MGAGTAAKPAWERLAGCRAKAGSGHFGGTASLRMVLPLVAKWSAPGPAYSAYPRYSTYLAAVEVHPYGDTAAHRRREGLDVWTKR